MFVKCYNEKEKEYLYSVEEIVEKARDSIGQTGYNLLFNNCEHFANFCTIGEYHSNQLTSVVLDIAEHFLSSDKKKK